MFLPGQYGHKADLCSSLEALGSDADDSVLMAGFADFTNRYYGQQFGSSCFYDSRCLADLGKATLNERSWRWQKCSQLAYFQASEDPVHSPQPSVKASSLWAMVMTHVCLVAQVAPAEGSLRSSLVNLSYAFEQCDRIFNLGGKKPETTAINRMFGGARPKAGRVFFTDFSDDPWQQASVRRELGPDQPYELVTCDGCGHCMDFHAPQPTDPQPLIDARSRFERYVAEWLGEVDEALVA